MDEFAVPGNELIVIKLTHSNSSSANLDTAISVCCGLWTLSFDHSAGKMLLNNDDHIVVDEKMMIMLL